MKVWLAAILAFLMGSAARANAESAEGLYQYSMTPVISAQGLKRLDFTLSFQADRTGPVTIDLPDHWGGGERLYRHLEDLTVHGAQSVNMPDEKTRVAQVRAGETIRVTWHIDANLDAGHFPDQDGEVDPAISPDYFHLFGQAAFAVVRDSYNASARFNWAGPEDWNFVSPLEARELTVNNIIQSVSLAGPQVKVSHLKTPHTDLRVASVGDYNFDLGDFNAAIARTLATEQAFWGDGQKAFVVTLSPVHYSGAVGLRGSGESNAFDMLSSAAVPEDMLKITLAHEYFHNWNPIALGGPEAGATPGYWFSEGVTDYYGRKMALRAGTIDLRAFVAAWNEVLDTYAASPVRDAPNTLITEQFWKSHDADQLAYQRGAILAVHWNRQWRNRGVTLDQFMIAFRDGVDADPKMADKTFPARLQIIADRLGVPIADDLARHVIKGVPVTLPEDAFGGCLRLADVDVKVMDFGYDAEKTGNTGVFAGVEVGSNAYVAGLRDGMTRLERLGGSPTDMTVPFSFHVRDTEGKEKIITYLPESQRPVRRRHLIIPDGLTNSQLSECAAQVAAY